MTREIAGEADLYRYVYPGWILRDGISSAAFNDEDLSCDDGSLCAADSTHDRLDGGRGGGVARFSADFARAEEQVVVPDPELENPAHVLVKGKKSKSRRRKFALEADRRGWAVTPTTTPGSL